MSVAYGSIQLAGDTEGSASDIMELPGFENDCGEVGL